MTGYLLKNQIKSLVLATLLTVSGCATTQQTAASDSPPVPPDVIQKGSLANQKLILDTGVAASAKLASMGHRISQNQAFQPYVLAKPIGDPGSRTWTERWYFKIGDAWIPLIVDFKENGVGAADYAIRTDPSYAP